jgi:hypothetical protein
MIGFKMVGVTLINRDICFFPYNPEYASDEKVIKIM